jgi:hypothetical protein
MTFAILLFAGVLALIATERVDRTSSRWPARCCCS